MKLLIIGGTWFLGRHLVGAAIARGHEVTLFNRGREKADLFPPVEKLTGDRDGGLAPLKGRLWDAAIDTCGYVPRVVRASAELLADSVGYYAFTSSCSVYADFSTKGMDEGAPVGGLEDETGEEITGDTYGPLKARCEKVVEEVFPGRALCVRAGLIVGPHDYVDRFTYWVRRVARGGEVLAPGDPERQVELVDARDLADWIVRMSESRRAGVFNATGPDYRLTMRRLLEECRDATGSNASFTWASDEFLTEQKVVPWVELPIWIPEEQIPKWRGFLSIDCSKAIAAGLEFRPLAQTVRDTLAWDQARTEPLSWPDAFGGIQPSAVITPEREADLLRVWRGQP